MIDEPTRKQLHRFAQFHGCDVTFKRRPNGDILLTLHVTGWPGLEVSENVGGKW